MFERKKGRSAVEFLKGDEYRRMKETLDVLKDPYMMRQIRASDRYLAEGGKGLSFEQVFGEPTAAAEEAHAIATVTRPRSGG